MQASLGGQSVPQLPLKLDGGQTVLEGHDSVHCHNRDIKAVESDKRRIGVDVYFFESEFVITAGGEDFTFGFIAEMATGTRVDDDVGFVGHDVMYGEKNRHRLTTVENI